MNVELVKLFPDVEIPEYATEGSAGFDLKAHSFKAYYNSRSVDQQNASKVVGTTVLIAPHSRLLCGTGLKAKIPQDFEMQIRPRSGNALKKGLTVLNAPGTIDSDYRDEIGVILYNSSNFGVEVKLGDKIAQGVVTSYCKVNFIEVERLDETGRKGGFGHTDKPRSIHEAVSNYLGDNPNLQK